MHLLHKFVSSTLCCFGTHQEDALERPATLRNLPNNVSNISMTMPTASVPHVASTSEELRKIFASDATPGGYNAAANRPPKRLPPQGSLDLSFQFGSAEQPKKTVGRVEQITHHIKQKLSESRLSRGSVGDKASDSESNRRMSTGRVAADESTELLGVSQRSTGLTDLLTSRAGSEGGYDSDVRSIQTPMLRSNAVTFRISPVVARKSLKTILSESNQESLELQMRVTEDEIPATSSSKRVEGKSSPLPMTPAKASFTDAIQIAPGESPSDALRRLSMGIANGTIKIPTTPELRASRLPSASEVEHEWRTSVRAPQRTSSLSKGAIETESTLKRLSDRVAIARSQSSTTSSSKCQHDSLISELDPALLKYIERYARGDELERHSLISSPTTVIKIHNKDAVEDRRDNQKRPDSITQSLANSTQDLSSPYTSAGQSVHLFNMRISQRLASSSRAPMLSSPNSNSASTQSLATQPDSDPARQSSSISISRHPSFLTTERICYPSDPETRKKFEKVQKPQSNFTDQKLIRLQQQGFAAASKESQPSTMRDDASSVYDSDFAERKSTYGFFIPTSRRSSLRNPNSLAIGGRSVSEDPPRRTHTDDSIMKFGHDHPCRQDTLDGLRETEDVSDALSIKARSFSLPAKHRVSIRSKPQSQQAIDTTEDNEQLSEISIRAVDEKHNETFSEVEVTSLDVVASMNKVPGQISGNGFVQDDCPTAGFLSVGKDINKTPYRLPMLSDYTHRISIDSPSERPMAVVKRRAARQQTLTPEVPPILLQYQQLDSVKDRQTSIGSVSDPGIPSITFGSVLRQRSLSIDGDRPLVSTSIDMDKLHRKSLPILGSINTGPISNKAQTWIDRGKLKKKSILDVRRRFTTVNVPNEDKKAQTSTKVGVTSSIWAGFPSHTREQRNGAAAMINSVQARDFIQEESATDFGSPLATQSTLSFQSRTSTSRRFLNKAEATLNRNKTKSLNFNLSLEERAKRGRNGLVGRFRRLYRTSSSDFKAFTNTHGYRGSISLGKTLEYPELECTPAERLFVTSQKNQRSGDTDVDGADDRPVELGTSSVSQSEYSNEASTSVNSTDWVGLYADCIGSLSALRSSSELCQKSLPQLDFIVRDSTEEFEADLVRDAAEAKARLHRQVQKGNSSASRKVHDRLSIELKIPGSFE